MIQGLESIGKGSFKHGSSGLFGIVLLKNDESYGMSMSSPVALSINEIIVLPFGQP